MGFVFSTQPHSYHLRRTRPTSAHRVSPTSFKSAKFGPRKHTIRGQNLRNELTAFDATHLNVNVNDGRHRHRLAST